MFDDAVSRNFNPLAHLNSLHLRIRFNFNVFMFLAGSRQPLIWPFIIPIPGSLKLVSPSLMQHTIIRSQSHVHLSLDQCNFWSSGLKIGNKGFPGFSKPYTAGRTISELTLDRNVSFRMGNNVDVPYD